MNDDVIRDLERWEKGDLGDAEMVARHPEHAALLRTHRTLQEIASVPVPPAERSWQRVRLSLEVRRPRRFWRMAPAIALGSIALLMAMGAVAAATAPVHTAEAIHHAFHLVGLHPHPHDTPAHTPTQTPHPPSPTPHR